MTIFQKLNNFFLISLIIIVAWYSIANKPQKKQLDNRPTAQEYMVNLKVSNYDTNGKIKDCTIATYWEFIPNLERSNLIKPHVTVYKPSGTVWHVSSETAYAWHQNISDKIQQLDMLKNVIMEQDAVNNATHTKIETEELFYNPNENTLTTTKYVEMRQPGLKVTGYGMLGQIDKDKVQLHEKVTTVYERSMR